jgi:hypothetical protein
MIETIVGSVERLDMCPGSAAGSGAAQAALAIER